MSLNIFWNKYKKSRGNQKLLIKKINYIKIRLSQYRAKMYQQILLLNQLLLSQNKLKENLMSYYINFHSLANMKINITKLVN